MGQLHDKMYEDMQLKGFAKTTQKEYLLRAGHFAAHYMRSPEAMGRDEIRAYLDTLAARPSRLKMAIAGLKYVHH